MEETLAELVPGVCSAGRGCHMAARQISKPHTGGLVVTARMRADDMAVGLSAPCGAARPRPSSVVTQTGMPLHLMRAHGPLRAAAFLASTAALLARPHVCARGRAHLSETGVSLCSQQLPEKMTHGQACTAS